MKCERISSKLLICVLSLASVAAQAGPTQRGAFVRDCTLHISEASFTKGPGYPTSKSLKGRNDDDIADVVKNFKSEIKSVEESVMSSITDKVSEFEKMASGNGSEYSDAIKDAKKELAKWKKSGENMVDLEKNIAEGIKKHINKDKVQKSYTAMERFHNKVRDMDMKKFDKNHAKKLEELQKEYVEAVVEVFGDKSVMPGDFSSKIMKDIYENDGINDTARKFKEAVTTMNTAYTTITAKIREDYYNTLEEVESKKNELAKKIEEEFLGAKEKVLGVAKLSQELTDARASVATAAYTKIKNSKDKLEKAYNTWDTKRQEFLHVLYELKQNHTFFLTNVMRLMLAQQARIHKKVGDFWLQGFVRPATGSVLSFQSQKRLDTILGSVVASCKDYQKEMKKYISLSPIKDDDSKSSSSAPSTTKVEEKKKGWGWKVWAAIIGGSFALIATIALIVYFTFGSK